MADAHGNCLYLGERECSVQRRHQKVIEEAPSAVVGEALRRSMGEAAVRLALSAGYVNAGTVEFLLDDAQNFYFLEVNTRLQVEHPVTELVTGLDLVRLQIEVARGEPLQLRQEQVTLRGHAIECRIYAEDPANGFMPSPGKITRLIEPSGPGVREDSGVYEGWTVPLDYDPMLSKLVVYAGTREAAIDRMQRALEEYVLGGIRTNLGLFRRILSDPDFQAARIDTGYLERLLASSSAIKGVSDLAQSGELSQDVVAIAAALLVSALSSNAAASKVSPPDSTGLASAERSPDPFRNWARAARLEALRA